MRIVIIVIIALLIAGELLLRGFYHPLVLIADDKIEYYPAPANTTALAAEFWSIRTQCERQKFQQSRPVHEQLWLGIVLFLNPRLS